MFMLVNYQTYLFIFILKDASLDDLKKVENLGEDKFSSYNLYRYKFKILIFVLILIYIKFK